MNLDGEYAGPARHGRLTLVQTVRAMEVPLGLQLLKGCPMSDVELVELEPQPAAVVRGHVPVDGIPGFLGEAYDEVMHVLQALGQYPAGPPFGRYERTESGFFIVAGFPTSAPITASGRVEPDTLPGGLAASLLYRGEYSGIAAAYEAAQQWLSDHGYRAAGQLWESYLDGPEVAQPRTILQIPCAALSDDDKRDDKRGDES